MSSSGSHFGIVLHSPEKKEIKFIKKILGGIIKKYFLLYHNIQYENVCICLVLDISRKNLLRKNISIGVVHNQI